MARTMLDYDALAEDYAQHRRVHPGVLRDLLSTGGLEPTSRVLEVGCGTGNYSAALHRAARCSYSGVDPSEQMLAQARKRGLPLRLAKGRAERLEFPDESFDLVFSVDVVHHVTDCAAYYRESYRVLAPGGRVCTVTDSEDIIRSREPLATYFPETVAVELVRYPRIEFLCRVMSLAGLSVTGDAVVEFVSHTTDIQMYRDKAFSCLHLIPNDAFDRGIRRMGEDLRAGPIRCTARYVMLWGKK